MSEPSAVRGRRAGSHRAAAAMVWSALLCTLALAPDVSLAEPMPLGGDEIRAALVGNSVTGETRDGPFTVYMPSYGTVHGLRSNHYRDTGKWRVDGDELCLKWGKWWGTKERCWNVSRDGDKVTWIQPDGRRSETATILEGNPHGL